MPQVLIKWHQRPRDEATWEDFTAIKCQFPEFQLEDKLAVIGGGNVRDVGSTIGQPLLSQPMGGPKEKVWRVYVRRKKGVSSKGKEGKV